MALVDRGSFYVEGYFEETKLPGIQLGDPVDVTLMGTRQPIRGHVESFAEGIADRDRTTGANMLPNVNPTFNWVRLAQRIPVRIAIDPVPANVRLVAGQTATVQGAARCGGAAKPAAPAKAWLPLPRDYHALNVMNRYRSSVKLPLLLAAALAACTTVGPDYHVPKEAVIKRDAANAPFMGAAEQPFKSEPLPADWWRLYQDPRSTSWSPRPSPTTPTCAWPPPTWQRAHGVLEEVEEKKRPEVEMSAAPLYGRIAGASLGLPGTAALPRHVRRRHQGRLQLDLWGRIRRAIEAAEADGSRAGRQRPGRT
jgi:hypothetical protein